LFDRMGNSADVSPSVPILGAAHQVTGEALR
jgi:hypothetical protein